MDLHNLWYVLAAILVIVGFVGTIVPALQRRGYVVTFKQFAGGHTVPSEVAREGMQWVAAKP